MPRGINGQCRYPWSHHAAAWMVEDTALYAAGNSCAGKSSPSCGWTLELWCKNITNRWWNERIWRHYGVRLLLFLSISKNNWYLRNLSQLLMSSNSKPIFCWGVQSILLSLVVCIFIVIITMQLMCMPKDKTMVVLYSNYNIQWYWKCPIHSPTL